MVGVLRVGVSLAILYLIFYKVGVAAPLERIAGLDWRALLAATVLLVITMVLHAKRWLLVLSSSGYSWRFRSALSEMWIGYFFNQLLPSSVGGDGVRALRQYRSGVPAVTAVRVILTERVFGFIACTLLGVLAIPVMLRFAPTAAATAAVGITVVMGLVGILVLLNADSRLLDVLPKRLAHEVRLVGAALRHRNGSAAAMAVSFAMQLCIACMVGVLSLGLGVDANPLLVALLFQPVTLITLVPITLAGWGIREGALVAVLSAIGVPSSDALPLSLCFGALLLFVSLPGWFFLAVGKSVGPQRGILHATGNATVA
jgi:uncharacterized protein (TIRG00374 family)